MRKISIPFFVLLLSLGYCKAQQSTSMCGSEIPSSQWENEFQLLIQEFEAASLNKNASDTNITYTIPVICHIIHGGEAVGSFPNIDSGQVYAQIDVINQDLNGIGKNVSTYPANAFTTWAVNEGLAAGNLDSLGRVKIGCLNVQFCPAMKDASGNTLPEPGINRIDFASLGVADPTSFSTTGTLKSYLDGSLKPKTIWDAKKYLNIWVTDRNAAIGYTGVATTPPFSTLPGIGTAAPNIDSIDGIWCYAKAFGSNSIYPGGIYGSPNVEGRTVTHEVGHWLGLRHIWGDGACANDFCDDTPPAGAQNIGISTYPHNVGTCSSPSNAPDGEMFMNFMDYTLDPYKYMFSPDQMTRMHTALLNSPNRNALGTHGLCGGPTVSVAELGEGLVPSIYPNPGQRVFTIKDAIDFEKVRVVDLTGHLVFERRMFVEDQMEIDLSGHGNGIYFVHLQSENAESVVLKVVLSH